jgi:hypothetical protein
MSLFHEAPMWTYAVVALDAYGKRIAPPIHIRAPNAAQAERISKPLHRMFGVKGKFYPKAYLYSPANDPAMRQYIRIL